MTTTPSHRDIFTALAELSSKVDGLADAIGCEHTDESGRITGTGLTGRIIRTEAKVLSYDRLKERMTGALLTLSAACAILWWLVKGRVARALGVTP